MAVVDSNYRFVYIDVGAYGEDCDSSVFQRTNFYRMLTDGRLNVPQPALIREGSDVKLDRLCGLVVRVSGYRYRGAGFDPRRYQIF